MTESDDLVALGGVLIAGRFGRDWSIAEQKSKALYLENPAATEMAQWFCAAITMMLSSMAHAIDTMNQTGFGQTSWLPMKSWSYSGGDYAVGVRGDQFLIAERAKLKSVDELDRLLRKDQPNTPATLRDHACLRARRR
jgi:roadblock/LC7 domain-containing protein